MWFLFVVINTAVLTLNLCYCIHVAIFLFTAAVFIGSSKRFICSWGVKTFFIKKEKRKKKKEEEIEDNLYRGHLKSYNVNAETYRLIYISSTNVSGTLLGAEGN